MDAATLARLDELDATNKLDGAALVKALAPFPKSYALGGAATAMPKPDDTAYDRPPFGDITADMNAVMLLIMKTAQKVELAFRRSELTQRYSIIENAAKQRKTEKEAADKRYSAAVASASMEIAGGVIGLGGAGVSGLKLRSASKSSGEHTGALKQIEHLKDAKQTQAKAFKAKNRELDDQIDAADANRAQAARKVHTEDEATAFEAKGRDLDHRIDAADANRAQAARKVHTEDEAAAFEAKGRDLDERIAASDANLNRAVSKLRVHDGVEGDLPSLQQRRMDSHAHDVQRAQVRGKAVERSELTEALDAKIADKKLLQSEASYFRRQRAQLGSEKDAHADVAVKQRASKSEVAYFDRQGAKLRSEKVDQIDQKMAQKNLQREVADYGRQGAKLRSEKADVAADDIRFEDKTNREIDRLKVTSEGGHSKADTFNASARNWTAGAQAGSALANGFGKQIAASYSQEAEYKDADAKFTNAETQQMTMRQESFKSGADNLAGAVASAIGTANAIESSRGEFAKSTASSWRA
ncbi:hypothetical protein [Caenimonas koreensis]|uniref:hypothetical protein n=1 Tax=Caenimonas koreensis TaxID=367474 RepID=UPI00378455B7